MSKAPLSILALCVSAVAIWFALHENDASPDARVAEPSTSELGSAVATTGGGAATFNARETTPANASVSWRASNDPAIEEELANVDHDSDLMMADYDQFQALDTWGSGLASDDEEGRELRSCWLAAEQAGEATNCAWRRRVLVRSGRVVAYDASFAPGAPARCVAAAKCMSEVWKDREAAEGLPSDFGFATLVTSPIGDFGGSKAEIMSRYTGALDEIRALLAEAEQFAGDDIGSRHNITMHRATIEHLEQMLQELGDDA